MQLTSPLIEISGTIMGILRENHKALR
jgi:hypothetical protein